MNRKTPADVLVDKPTSARAYGWILGSKDNLAVDRQSVLDTVRGFPECVDIARQNRLFLYRAVRYLVQEAGITQFIDLGCGLPTGNNVHQVAQQFNPDARVVYVDIDPVVLAHGRALLAKNRHTTVITADMRRPDTVLEHPDACALIDLTQPVAVLYLSVVHHLMDSDTVGHGPRHTLRHIVDEHAAPGSYLAVSQIVADDPAIGARMSAQINSHGVPWQTRTPAQVDQFLDGLEPVDPGLVNLHHWRPDPTQPDLSPAPAELHPYVGITATRTHIYEYGGVLRKPAP